MTQRKGCQNIVTTLVAGLEGKGYHIYMDNFYSSPELFSNLFQGMWNSDNKQGWNPKIFSELFCCQRSVYYNYYPLLLLLLLESATAKTTGQKNDMLKVA